MNKLWVFGDSFSTPYNHVDPRDSFWGLVATYVGARSITNCSRLGNSFDTVGHLIVSMQDQYDWDNDLFLICVPPLERITVFDDFKDTPYIGHTIDSMSWESAKFDISCHRGLISLQNFGLDKELIIHSDRSWLELQAMRQVFLLSSWLESMNTSYLILNMSRKFDGETQWPPSQFLINSLSSNNKCLLFSNTYRDVNIDLHLPADFEQYGWDGHHGPSGNKYFFETSILPLIKNDIC